MGNSLIRDFHIEPFTLKINGPFQTRKGLLVYGEKLDGTLALSEISPLPGFSQESFEEAFDQIQSLKSFICQRPWEEISNESLLPSVAFGLESLFSLPSQPKVYPVCGFLHGNFETMQKEIPLLLEEGYTSIKMKPSQLSLEEFHRVIEMLLGKTKLKIDLNRHWDLKKSLSFFERYPLDAFEYIEEPVNDSKDLPFFPYPTALDETLREGLSVIPPQVKAFIIKPMLTGSLKSIQKWVDFAKKRNIQTMLSSSFESGVGLFHLCSLLERAQIPIHPLGVDNHRLIVQDVLKTPHVISKGHLHLSPLKVSHATNPVS